MIRGRTAACCILAAGWLLLAAAAGCGRKAKPEPLWGRVSHAAASGEAAPSFALPGVPAHAVRKSGDGPIPVPQG
jgi:hypothetical protein